MTNNRDVWWHEIVQNEQGQEQQYCKPEILDILIHCLFYTHQGLLGNQKASCTHAGGYLTHLYATAKLAFDFRSTDIFFLPLTLDGLQGTAISYMNGLCMV